MSGLGTGVGSLVAVIYGFAYRGWVGDVCGVVRFSVGVFGRRRLFLRAF